MKANTKSRAEVKERVVSSLRTMVQYEAEQVNRRVGWLGTLQGLLFAALALGWGKSQALARLIAVLGFVVAALVFCGLLSAAFSCRRIRKRWRDFGSEGEDPTDVFGSYPDSTPWAVFVAPELLIPIAFAIAWTVIFAIVPAESGNPIQ